MLKAGEDEAHLSGFSEGAALAKRPSSRWTLEWYARMLGENAA